MALEVMKTNVQVDGWLKANNGLFDRGMPLLPTRGNVFHVDSGHAAASDNNGGKNPDYPLATIDAAIGKCTASNGDTIIVAEGHAETLTAAAAILMDVAGVTIIGLGYGSLKPTLTFGTAATATIQVTALNCRLVNFRLVCNIDSLEAFLNLDEGFFWCEDCDFVTSSTKEALCFISIATTKDNFWFKRCTFLQPTDPAGTDGAAETGCVFMVDSENIFFEDCHFYGNFETAIFHNRTTACKNLWVKNCSGVQLLAGAEPFQLVATANGAMLGGGFITPAEAAAVEATLVGTLGDAFFILQPGSFGNDGGAGGQGGIVVTAAS